MLIAFWPVLFFILARKWRFALGWAGAVSLMIGAGYLLNIIMGHLL